MIMSGYKDKSIIVCVLLSTSTCVWALSSWIIIIKLSSDQSPQTKYLLLDMLDMM